ncbi:hypothetical protein BVRB_3g070080 [Beta vulgaris subsp. vulgaris]|nr:hypothetical protein BVRB_3g070080 [Beta vulgaris subsp. vulgaris]
MFQVEAFVGPAAARRCTAGVGASTLARCVAAPPSCLAGPATTHIFPSLSLTPLFSLVVVRTTDAARRCSTAPKPRNPIVPLFFAAVMSRGTNFWSFLFILISFL